MLWLYILLGIAAFFALLLLAPIVVTFGYAQDKPALSVRYLFVRLRLAPAKPKPRRAKGSRKAAKAEKQAAPKKKKPLQNLVAQNGVLGAVKLLVQTVKTLSAAVLRLLAGARLRRLRLTVGVAGEDAAAAALTYGEVCALVYPFLGWVSRQVKLIRPQIDLHADYLSSQSTLAVSGKLYITAGHAVGTVLGAGWRIIRNYLTNYKGGKQHERNQESANA